MATKLDIWNQALRLLGEHPLQTLTDDLPSRYALEQAWPRVVVDGLSRGVFNFAIKTAQFDANESVTPAIGYTFAFDKPDDWLFTNVVSTFPDFRDYLQTEFQGYRDQGGRWHADSTPLYVEYASTDFTQDENISAWSELFVQFIAASLALDLTEILTQSTTKLQYLQGLAKERLLIAKSRDAKDERETRVRAGSWARAQRGYGFRSNRQRIQGGGEIQTREGQV